MPLGGYRWPQSEANGRLMKRSTQWIGVLKLTSASSGLERRCSFVVNNMHP
jgi:hypothetical protein